MMRAPLALMFLCLPALTACGPVQPAVCTLIGCQDAVTVQSSQLASLLPAEPTLTVRLCLDGQCTEAVEDGGSCRDVLRLRCAGDTITVFLQRSDDLSASPHVVTIAISRPDGTMLLSERIAGVRFHGYRPNGPRCEPTCYSATVRLPDA